MGINSRQPSHSRLSHGAGLLIKLSPQLLAESLTHEETLFLDRTPALGCTTDRKCAVT